MTSEKNTTELEDELKTLIAHHKKWEGRDFTWAQVFVWGGIIASGTSSIYGSGITEMGHFFAAVVGAIPGVLIVVDKTFKFSARASWHARYRAALNSLFRKLRDENSPVPPISQALSKLESEMERDFPPMDPEILGGKRR
ncbi:hypothetical protein [Rugamonas apoptosis]|uniref:SMODS and SLOG-associating 2TM effector domain-containing protein n=1 Tax=Rugamonas apoptosis TaxID=2758570 RepID=A0A7W2IM50_9BURK|nr:hypothetical protein [Rugamonas apoptosis]MBA5689161.1 hypothetical protein [Rugamonas apoptosis]